MTRPDNSRMHTAEHVLNQTMVRVLGCGRCFSAHINPKKSKCDYRFDRPLSDAEAGEIEFGVNEVLAAGVAVHVQMMPLEQARESFDLTRLPDPSVEAVRIVHVGDYDSCPCSGDHVSNTSEIGPFCLTTHSWEDGVLRLRFKLSPPAEDL